MQSLPYWQPVFGSTCGLAQASAKSPGAGSGCALGGRSCQGSLIYVVADKGATSTCDARLGATPEAIDPRSGRVSDPGARFGTSAAAVATGDQLLLFRNDGSTALGTAYGERRLRAISPAARGVGAVGLCANVSVNPTGQYIAYLGPNGDIHYAAVTRRGRDRDLRVSGTNPKLSPDGARVAFLGTSGLSVIRTNGTALKALPGALTDYIPGAYSWFPDGRRIARLDAARQGNCDGYRAESFSTVDVTTGRVVHFPLNESSCPAGADGRYFIPQDIAVSPDGTEVAIAGAFSDCSPAPGYTCAGGELFPGGLFFQGQVITVPARGGNPTIISRLPGECPDPANAGCVDPTGGAIAPANIRPSFRASTLSWGPTCARAPKLAGGQNARIASEQKVGVQCSHWTGAMCVIRVPVRGKGFLIESIVPEGLGFNPSELEFELAKAEGSCRTLATQHSARGAVSQLVTLTIPPPPGQRQTVMSPTVSHRTARCTR